MALTLTVAIITLTSHPVASAGRADEPRDVDAPVVGAKIPRGQGRPVFVGHTSTIDKRVDGAISDWQGESAGFAGISLYSRGEFVYQDHLFDAYGAADGEATQAQTWQTVEDVEPRSYRLRALGQFGLEGLHYTFGAAPLELTSDLLELRVAADNRDVQFLARTTVMRNRHRLALLVLADTVPDSASHKVPFASGLETKVADVAFLISAGRIAFADLASGNVSELPSARVAVSATGYRNALEAAVPRSLIVSKKDPAGIRIAVASGRVGDGGKFAKLEGLEGGPRLANVGFRHDEPVEPVFDRLQALALHERTIDPFFAAIDLKKLTSGYTERYQPGPGYHVRTFTVPRRIAEESGNRGIHRDYGVYLPDGSSQGSARPLTTFLHGASGSVEPQNHAYSSVMPGLVRDFGDRNDSIVIFPADRQVPVRRSPVAGSWSAPYWYAFWMGESLVELQAAWREAFARFDIDEDRQYLTGYSMGGFAAYLLPPLMPDRFAGVHAIAGGIFDGDPATESPAWPAANALEVIDNMLHVPTSAYIGTLDPSYADDAEAARRLTDLRYRHRLYTFPTHDHYSPGIMDEWAEATRYLAPLRRDRNPARVRFVRDMALERRVEQGGYAKKFANPAVKFSFDSAYWVSELTPTDPKRGRAEIDARSLGIPEFEHREVIEAGGPSAPGQSGPYVMSGVGWELQPTPVVEPANEFRARLAGARAVRLDVARMDLSTSETIRGTVTTEQRLHLKLVGDWQANLRVTLNGAKARTSLEKNVLTVRVPSGRSELTIRPRARSARS